MKKHIIAIIVILLFSILACGGGGVQSNESGSSPKTQLGWLCDYDRTGSIRLWTAASMDATVKDVVGTCNGCCVDVNLDDEDLVNGILFYKIRVGSQSGWVDVDYYYRNKPTWATN